MHDVLSKIECELRQEIDSFWIILFNSIANQPARLFSSIEFIQKMNAHEVDHAIIGGLDPLTK